MTVLRTGVLQLLLLLLPPPPAGPHSAWNVLVVESEWEIFTNEPEEEEEKLSRPNHALLHLAPRVFTAPLRARWPRPEAGNTEHPDWVENFGSIKKKKNTF